MKVLFLIDSLGSGGAQRQLTLVARYLKISDFDVSIVCYNKDDFYDFLLENSNISVTRIISSNYLERIFKIRRFIRNGKFNAVISFLDVPNFINNFAAIGGNNWKVITSERSSKKEKFNSKQGKFFGWFQRYSDSIVCNSENAKNLWHQFYPQYSNKLSTIYNFVNVNNISSNYMVKKDNNLQIIVIASFQYLKNPIGLIKALSLLTNDEKDLIQVNWYGRIEVTTNDTRAYDETYQLIHSYNLEKTIHLHRETKDILNLINEADVVALFSRVEGLPNTICEGMSLGKPIIMSKVSDYSVLVDSSNGFLCDWDNPESIKDTLVSAINLSEDQLIDMGKKSKRKADQLFDSDVIINQWIKLLH